ncbi:MAG: NADH-quinone oxidoreductase subunit N [Chthoniobacteraceae bacterium]
MQQVIPAIALEVIVVLLGVLMLMAEAFSRRADRSHMAKYAIGVLAALLGMSFFTKVAPEHVAGSSYWAFYAADATALFFKRIALGTTIVFLVMAIEYRHVLAKFIPGGEPGQGTGEFFSLPIFVCAGLMFMASAVDFILIFVALELVTIGFYVLVAYTRRNGESLEAGVKYLILGALSTGFLVYGITWIFGLTGETNLMQVKVRLMTGFSAPSIAGGHGAGELLGNETALLFGIMLILVALGFKVAAAPFQLWVPDVYQGAPTPVTAFLSVGSKAAGFVVLVRTLDVFLAVPAVSGKVVSVLALLAAATLLYGNLTAMPQDNLKRLFAYSSIAHAGYLLIACAALLADPVSAKEAISFYLAGYLVMTLLSFLILIVVACHSRGDDIRHFNGLGRRSPVLAAAMTVAVASLAGVPLTAGFLGKFLVFKTAIASGLWVLIGLGIVTVAAGFYYYFKVVAAMYWQEPNDSTPIRMSPLTGISVIALASFVIILGVFPGLVLEQLKERATPAPLHVAGR